MYKSQFKENTITNTLVYDIENAKERLENYSKQFGFQDSHGNYKKDWGQSEVIKLIDKYYNRNDFSSDTKKIKRLLIDFSDWCWFYSGNTGRNIYINKIF